MPPATGTQLHFSYTLDTINQTKMKKILTKSSLIYYLILASLCFIGCEQDELPGNFIENQDLSDIQTWLTNEHIDLGKSVLWDYAKPIEFESAALSMITVPLKVENEQHFEIAVFTISENKITGVLWTMISDEGFFSDSYYQLTTHEILQNFSGILLIKYLDKDIEESVSYVDGSIAGINNSVAGRVSEWPSACGVCHNATILDEVIITPGDDGGGDDWWFNDPCNTNYDPCTCDGIGCGGGPSGGDTWSSDLELFQDVGEKISDVSDYLDCFNASSGATLSLYVDQPTPNSRDTWSGWTTNPDVGHTFISISQGSYTRVLGFYPNDGVNPLTSPSTNSTLVNDEGHPYDVRITTNLSSTELQNLLDFVESYRNTYNLNTYNCTDFGIQCMGEANINLTDTYGSWPGGGGSNPGDLGQDIRSMSSNSDYTIDNSGGTAPSNSGNCN